MSSAMTWFEVAASCPLVGVDFADPHVLHRVDFAGMWRAREWTETGEMTARCGATVRFAPVRDEANWPRRWRDIRIRGKKRRCPICDGPDGEVQT